MEAQWSTSTVNLVSRYCRQFSAVQLPRNGCNQLYELLQRLESRQATGFRVWQDVLLEESRGSRKSQHLV
jgi:hypothetical protein